MGELVRRVPGSSLMLIGRLASERLSELVGMALCTGPSDVGSATGMVGVGAGFAPSWQVVRGSPSTFDGAP